MTPYHKLLIINTGIFCLYNCTVLKVSIMQFKTLYRIDTLLRGLLIISTGTYVRTYKLLCLYCLIAIQHLMTLYRMDTLLCGCPTSVRLTSAEPRDLITWQLEWLSGFSKGQGSAKVRVPQRSGFHRGQGSAKVRHTVVSGVIKYLSTKEVTISPTQNSAYLNDTL